MVPTEPELCNSNTYCLITVPSIRKLFKQNLMLRVSMKEIILTTAIGVGILLVIAAFSNGFNSVYAKHDTVRVDCKDLAIDIITWDQLLATTDDGERTDIEDNLGEDGIANGLFQDWIDKYLDDLVEELHDHCNNLDNDIEDYLDDMELEVP